jgi:Neuraminidase (sialidase)
MNGAIIKMLRKRVAVLIASTVFIGIVLLGCQLQTKPISIPSNTTSQSNPISNNSDSTKISTAPTKKPTTDSTWYPLHRTRGVNGEDIIFIDTEHGWKLEYKGAGAGSQDVVLYRTNDGGKNWVQVSKTLDEKYTNPVEQKHKSIPLKIIN